MLDRFDVKKYLNDQRDRVNQALSAYIKQVGLSSLMGPPVEYTLMGNGKRVRPILCLATCEAVGADWQKAIPAACALEMIHTYSLIHDDLPALDDDNLRRGRETCHVKFNEATAILTGDALLTMAFEVLADAGLQSSEKHIGQWMEVIALIGHAAGCRGMVEGQAQDLAFEGHRLNQEQLETLHAHKTGDLIRASVLSGGIIGQAGQRQLSGLKKYAEKIGLAFQVMDDILNVVGDPKFMGKAVGTDQERQKNTYTRLMGLEQAIQYAQSLIGDALQALVDFDTKADPLRAIARYIVERKR